MAYLRERPDGTRTIMPLGITRLGDLSWSVKTPLSPAGHEAITRAAIGGGTITFPVGGKPTTRVLTPAEQATIIAGNRSVDLGWAGTGVLFAFNKGEQKRHALRREYGQPLAAALADIIASLRAQHSAILTEPDPTKQLHRIGQAMHLVQDSFSPAHTDRRPGSGWCIAYVRNYGRGRAPTEHGVPSDDRDQVARSRGEASQATAASRRYLSLLFKALYGRVKPDPTATAEAAAEFARFVSDLFRSCSGASPAAGV